MGELAAPFQMTRPAVSQHVKVLCDAGLIERQVQAQWRSCTLRAAPLDEAERWVEEHRAAWNTRFDHLDDHLARTNGPFARRGPGFAWTDPPWPRVGSRGGGAAAPA